MADYTRSRGGVPVFGNFTNGRFSKEAGEIVNDFMDVAAQGAKGHVDEFGNFKSGVRGKGDANSNTKTAPVTLPTPPQGREHTATVMGLKHEYKHFDLDANKSKKLFNEKSRKSKVLESEEARLASEKTKAMFKR